MLGRVYPGSQRACISHGRFRDNSRRSGTPRDDGSRAPMRSALKLRCEELGAPFSSGEFVANSGNRVTQMALVRYYSAFFQDQLQAPYIGDVLERIGGDHNQVGELAHLHRAQLGPDAAHRSAMARGCYQRLPRCGAVADPEPHLKQRGLLERADVGAQCHSYTGIERLAEPRGVHVRGCLGAATQRRRWPTFGNPVGFERIGRLARGKMADREGRYVPSLVLEQEREALVVHDVAMLDAMRAQPDRTLHRFRVGGMRHDLEATLPADLEG